MWGRAKCCKSKGVRPAVRRGRTGVIRGEYARDVCVQRGIHQQISTVNNNTGSAPHCCKLGAGGARACVVLICRV